MIQLTVDNIRKELGDIIVTQDESIDYSMRLAIERLAIKHFGRLPYLNQLTDSVFDKIDVTNVEGYTENDVINLYDDDCSDEELREKHQGIDMDRTVDRILKAYPDAIEFYYAAAKKKNAIIFHRDFIYFYGIFYMDCREMPQKMLDCIEKKKETAQIRWVLRDRRGSIRNRYMEITPMGDIEGNYNDDFAPVNKKVQDLIRRDESCIIILHGKPGTGKTSYIRSLIDQNRDIKFYWIDSSMFAYVDSSEFIEFIASCKDAVFVLEDSESLLTSREEQRNPAMQSLLNISDGMLGDSLKLKFICTFNTDLKNIDKAILRKGRLKVKYEFKELSKDKVGQLLQKLGFDASEAKEMPLSDVYMYAEDNGYREPVRNKIGF